LASSSRAPKKEQIGFVSVRIAKTGPVPPG
jgi:hypothetical protein